MTIAFRVMQVGHDIERGQVVSVREVIGDFPATLGGIYQAFRAARSVTFGREPGRVAPKLRGLIFAIADGKPVIVRGTDEVFEVDESWLDNSFRRRPKAKTRLLEDLLGAIRQHVNETAIVS